MVRMPLDAVARLMLDEAGELPARVLVIDDAGGALTTEVAESGREVRTYCDDLRDAEAIPPALRLDTLADPFVAAADLVLLRLPASLAELEDDCDALISAGPRAGLRVVTGGRIKHMTRGQNDVLAARFAEVHASLGRQKCRVLHAAGPLGTPPRWPAARELPGLGLVVWAHGGAFSGNRLDAGTGLLVRALDGAGVLAGRGSPAAERGPALDLGSGSGILATLLARAGWRVEASDVSAAAVASTRLTASANGVTVGTVRRDGLRGVPDAAFDLIVSNPPFHQGAAKDSTPTLEAIGDARRCLAPGGELWLVFNSHLPYLDALRRRVGPTAIVARDRHYTVTRSTARRP